MSPRFPLIVPLVILIVVGCATQRQLPREQYEELITRTYPEHSANEVSNAAAWVLKLADGEDVRFDY